MLTEGPLAGAGTHTTVCSTDVVAPEQLAEVRAMLDAAFGHAFSDDDWQHTIGGVHAIVTDGSSIVAHAAVVPRTLITAGHTLATGYVEGVATQAEHRRRGHASHAMTALAAVIDDRYDIGALSTDVPEVYAALGWEMWRGPTAVMGPHGHERTPDDDGGVMVLRTRRTPPLDVDELLVCDWRKGDVW